MSRRRAKSNLGEQFIAHRREMRESPAWIALPDRARRILDRIEVEHMRHAGSENGSLVCSYEDFVISGLRRGSVALAIRQCAALGFLEVNRRGYRTAKTFRPPSTYRLTYVSGRGKSPPPTDDWRAVTSPMDATKRLAAAAEAIDQDRPTRQKPPPRLSVRASRMVS